MIIKGLNKKTKERIKNHGNLWVREDNQTSFNGLDALLLRAEDGYLAWFIIGQFTIVEE